MVPAFFFFFILRDRASKTKKYSSQNSLWEAFKSERESTEIRGSKKCDVTLTGDGLDHGRDCVSSIDEFKIPNIYVKIIQKSEKNLNDN